MKTKIAAALVAALTLSAASVATTNQAQAHHWGHGGWGWGAAGLGLAIGAAAAASAYSDCYWVRAIVIRPVAQRTVSSLTGSLQIPEGTHEKTVPSPLRVFM